MDSLPMSSCSGRCKWICIVSYVLAAVGAVIVMMDRLRQDKQQQPVQVPKILAILIGIAGIMTLVCAINWGIQKHK